MNAEYNFKKFTKIGSKLSNYTISYNGKSFTFGFNSGFYTRENISQYSKVVLFYDVGRNAVAFQFSNEQDAQGAFTVVHSNNQTTGSVTAKSFIIENKLDNEKYYGKKEPKKIIDKNIGELYVIELDVLTNDQ